MEHVEQRLRLNEIVEELYREKLITPAGGNISVRLPENQGYLITPSEMHKGSLTPGCLVFLNREGKPASETTCLPSIETPMHLKIYAADPTCGAVIHSHAPYATILGLYDWGIPPLTLGAVRFDRLPLIPFCLPGSAELAEEVAAALKQNPGCRALLLRNHGLITCGDDLRSAANTSLALEEVCHLVVTCRLLGEEPARIPAQYHELLKQYSVL